MKTKLWFLFTLVLAGILRFTLLDKFPVGLSADEASHGYDAWSLLLTGRDMWGHPWPLAFESFGDWKLPLYTYSSLLFIKFWGLNVFATRFAGALYGSLAVASTYYFVFQLVSVFPSNLRFQRWLPLMSCFLLAISPWHIQLSRGAFEANLSSFYLPLGFGLLIAAFRSSSRSKSLIYQLLAGIILSLNIYSYHAARVVTPLALTSLIIILYQQNFKKIFNLWLAISLPIFILILTLVLAPAGARASDVTVFNPTDNWNSVSDARYADQQDGWPTTLSLLGQNKLTYVIQQISKNALTYFSPVFLFIQGPGEATYGMVPGLGVLHWFEFIFIIFAIYALIRHPQLFLITTLLLIIVCFSPATISKGDGLAANRAATVLPFIHIISAYGFLYLISLTPLKFRVSILTLFILIISWSLISFTEFYFIQAPRIVSRPMNNGWQEVTTWIAANQSNFKQIIISRSFSEPQIYPMFYLQIQPKIVQQNALSWGVYRDKHLKFLDMVGEYQLANFIFRNPSQEDLEAPNTLIVGQSRDFVNKINPVFQVSVPDYPQSKPYLLLVSSNK